MLTFFSVIQNFFNFLIFKFVHEFVLFWVAAAAVTSEDWCPPRFGAFPLNPPLYGACLGICPLIICIMSIMGFIWLILPPGTTLPFGCLYAQFYLVHCKPNLHSISGCKNRHFSPWLHAGKYVQFSVGCTNGQSSFAQFGKWKHRTFFFITP